MLRSVNTLLTGVRQNVRNVELGREVISRGRDDDNGNEQVCLVYDFDFAGFCLVLKI